MATPTKNRSAGETVVAKALGEREKWEAALATAEADAAAANATIPDTPDDMDRIGERTLAARARVDAAGRALARAQWAEAEARRELLRRIADDVAAERAPVEREARTLDRKIAPLLRSLRDLDSVDYGPTPIATYDDGATVPAAEASAISHGPYTVQVSRRDTLARQIRELMAREAMLRYVADHGQTPTNGHALLGTEPIRDTAALERAGRAGMSGFALLTPPDEAVEYLDWLRQPDEAELRVEA